MYLCTNIAHKKNQMTKILELLKKTVGLVWRAVERVAGWYASLYKGRPWYVKCLSAIASLIVAFLLYLGAVDIDFLGLFGKSPSMNTILNTQDLIAEGKEVELPHWCQDLEALKKRIENGDRIFCIEMNQGGDGQNIGSIYALNGWDSDFNRYADVEMLGTWM